MIKAGFQRFLLFCCACLLIALVLEIAIRALGETDADGQFNFGGYVLPPYVLPLNRLRAEMDDYVNNRDRATLIPDPLIGWTYKPDSLRDDGGFTINSAGLRSQREYSLQPADDTLRIALFGDSFVAGDEVRDDEVWSHHLERLLNEAGTAAEVLNFGVGGYGMGQAFLRWKHEGKLYMPDIVIFVFQAENLDRNVNVFRSLHQRGIVYSKPRFIIGEGGLSLINSPALPPEDIITVFEKFDSHPLAAYEAHYLGRDKLSPLTNASRLAGLVHAALKRYSPAESPSQLYGPESERGALGKAIVDAFATDVAATNAEFFVLHLPRDDHFRAYHEGKRLPWRFLLDHVQAAYHFINAEDFLGVKYTDRSYYQPGRHYGPEINLKIAEAVTAELLTCIENRACEFARFPDTSFK